MAIKPIQTAMRGGAQDRAAGTQAALQGMTQAQQSALQASALGVERQKTRASLAAVAYQEKQANRRTLARVINDLTKFSIDEYLRWDQVDKENKAGGSLINKMSRLADGTPTVPGTVGAEGVETSGGWKEWNAELQQLLGEHEVNPFVGRARGSSPFTSPY